MTKILFIAPGNNPHTWKWVGWFGQHYPREISLIPYQRPVPTGKLEGVEIIEPVIPGFKIASIASWTEIGRVRRLVREINPKLLHVLWAYGSGTYGARSDFHPFVLSPWGTDVYDYPNRPGIKGNIQRRLVLEALESADHLTALSRFLGDKIKSLAPRKPVELLPWGVDTLFFDPATIDYPMKFPWPDGAPLGGRTVTLGFFKGLEYTYGPDILIDAVARLAPKMSGLRVIMAGTGSMKDQLAQKVKDLEIDNRFLFPGRIPEEEMPRAYAAIDIFVMPSRFESLGVAALEASAMKKPVIVTEYQGMKEVIIGGKTGLFIDPGDEMMLAEQIMKLDNEPLLRTKLGEAGRQFVKENFEFEMLMERADKFISRIIDKK